MTKKTQTKYGGLQSNLKDYIWTYYDLSIWLKKLILDYNNFLIILKPVMTTK